MYQPNNIAHANPFIVSDTIKDSHELNDFQKAKLIGKLVQSVSKPAGSIWNNWYNRSHPVTT